MEEKIYQAIVKGLGKTSLSERTLKAKAARLAKKITKDEDLTDEVVNDAVEDLKETEGQLNHEIAEKEKALGEKKQKEKEQKKESGNDQGDEPPSWFKKHQEEQEKLLKERLEKIEKDALAYQQDKQQKLLRETIQQKAKKLGIPEFAYLKFNPEKIEDIDAGLAEIQAGMVKSGLKPTSIPEGGGGESDPFAEAVNQGTEAIKASAKK